MRYIARQMAKAIYTLNLYFLQDSRKGGIMVKGLADQQKGKGLIPGMVKM